VEWESDTAWRPLGYWRGSVKILSSAGMSGPGDTLH